MSKVTLSTLTNIDNPSAFVGTLNANFATIQSMIDRLLARDGTAPNEMLAQLDMNSQRIINLPAPQSYNDAARHGELQTYVDSASDFADDAEAAATDAEDKDDDVTDKWLDFLSRYVGASSTDPVVDGASNILVEGALYYNTSSLNFFFYTDQDVQSNGVSVVSSSAVVEVTGWKPYPSTTLRSLSDVTAGDISSGQLLQWNGTIGKFQPYDASAYDIYFYFEGNISAGERLGRLVLNHASSMTGNFSDCQAQCRVAPLAQTVFDLYNDSTHLATITFGVGQTGGVFATTSGGSTHTLVAGSILEIRAPSPSDTLQSDVSVTLSLRRT